MRSFRILSHLVKSKRGKTLSIVVGLLLVLLTSSYALNQIVSKYPTGYTITVTDMGNGMTHDDGSVFGFNSAKSAADTDAYATIQEGACTVDPQIYDFTAGRQGFSTTASTSITYGYSGVQGHNAGGALQTRLRNSTTLRTYVWSKTFLWDCGVPSGAVPVSVWYKRGTWTGQSATPANLNLKVDLVKPDASVVNLIPAAQIGGTANSGWSELTAADVSANFNQAGVYTLRLTGNLQGLASSDLYLFLDDFSVGLNSAYESYTQDVEFTVRATPFSTLPSNAYLLDIRARKHSGDTETTDIQVWNGSSWTTRYSVNAGHVAWTTFNTYYLTTAEYNNGNVRIRYVDTVPGSDNNRGGIDVEYQRVTVDQSTCVDSVRDIEADCGKCHNYNGDVTKPWPNLGMHNKHAQSESTSDCAWCHPDHTAGQTIYPANHKDGIVEISGTKVYRVADGNLNGAPPTANYDGTTKQCSNVDCHRNLTTPAWTANFVSSGYDGVNNIARNCSRCHNSGVAGADNAANLNLNVAWPSTGDGGGHASHNAAFVIDEYSCQTNGSCHPDNRGNHSVVGDNKVVVKMAPNYGSPNEVIKYLPDTVNGTGKCANVSCHGGQVTPRFNLASTNPINLTLTNGTACIMCHTPEQADGWGTAPGNATQYNAPISGLHRGSPSTSGQDHATTVTNGCQGCHTLASLTKHFQFGGVTNLDTPAMDSMQGAAFVASIGYVAGTGTSPNYTTPPTCATTGTTTCHAENRTASRTTQALWPRKWSWDSYAAETPDSEKVKQCNGCHGHWGTFATGVVEPHVTSNSDLTLRNTLINNHSDSGVNCGTMCHAQTNVAYNHGVAVGAATKDMTLNSNVGFVDSGAQVGCNSCHANEGLVTPDGTGGNHVFNDAPWVTTTMLAGPTPSCYNPTASVSCHGNGSNEYWPNGTTTYPDREGRHDEHMAKLAAKLGYTLPGSDQEQKTMCAYCHTYTSYPGEGGHADQVAPADLASTAFNPIWSALTANYPSTADTGTAAAYTAADGTCSGIDCHNNKTTTAATYGWRDAGTSTCLMCHTVGAAGSNPNSGLHNITVAGPQHHDDGITGGCTACHNTTPPATHINGTFTADSGTNTVAERFINRTGMTYTEMIPTLGRSGTCSGTGGLASCHSDGGNWARLWSTEANSISTAPASTRCNVCHGQWSTISNSSGWMAGTTHYKAGGANVSTNSRGSGHDASTCDNCHVYGADGAGRHNVVTREINLNNNGATPGRTGAVYGTDTAGCGVCHGSQADTAHNFPISYFPAAYVSGTAVTGPSCTGCHDAGGSGAPIVNSTTGTHVKANGSTFGACTDCHASHADATTAGSNVIYVTTTGVPTMNNAYASAPHNNRIRLGGTVQNGGAKSTEAEWCWGCHDTYTTNNKTLTGVNVTFTVTTNTIAATGIGTKFAVGDWITITGSSNAANNRTFKVATSTANSITVTIPANETGIQTVASAAGVVIVSPLSEWGVNENVNTGSSTYDYGNLYTDTTSNTGTMKSDWTAASWRSGKGSIGAAGAYNPYWYKRGAVQSTHAANYGGTFTAAVTAGNSLGFNRTETVDAVGNIRCSYCHDVHGTHDGVNGDVAGQPYLRGSWTGNLYSEDGAPQYGMRNWDIQNEYGVAGNSVPRASAGTTHSGSTTISKVGGYWIDQNSGNPTGITTASTLAEREAKATATAGLCDQCHGTTKNGTWVTGEIQSIDQVTGEGLWVSSFNGHANAVVGGSMAETGTNLQWNNTTKVGRNIFNRTVRGSANMIGGSPKKAATDMGLSTETSLGNIGYSYRQATYGYNVKPAIPSNTRVFGYFAWNHTDAGYGTLAPTTGALHSTGTLQLQVTAQPPATGTEAAHNAQVNYHTFTCSKCHNPHASRLPKLMITNCLDTNHNTWANETALHTNTTQIATLPTPWTNKVDSMWASAQNCHRLDNLAPLATSPSNTMGAGWNKATPWQQQTAPNTLNATNPNP